MSSGTRGVSRVSTVVEKTRLTPGAPVMLLLMTGAILGVLLFLQVRRQGQHDFLPFYMGGQLATSGRIAEIYSKPAYQPLIAALRSQGVHMSRADAHYFIRPAFEAFLFIPFTWFAYDRASALMLLGNLALLAVLVWKLPDSFSFEPHRTLARCGLAIFYPFVWSILVGQDTLLLTLLIASALVLESRGKEWTAGILIGLCAWKPHLIWLMPPVFLAARRWKMATASAVTGGILIVISFLCVGMAGFRQWMQLVQLPSSDITPALMGNLRGLNLNMGLPMAAVACSVMATCFLIALSYGTFHEKVAAGLLVALLVSPHTYWQDYSLLALVAMITSNRTLRVLILVPWPYLYVRNDELPMVFIALIGLATFSRNGVARRWPALRAQALAG